MEAGNKKLYAKDISSIALTTQHKRGIIGAYVEGRIKIPNTGKTSTNQNSTSQNQSGNARQNRGNDQGSSRGTKTTRGRGGRGGRGRGSRGGATRKTSNESQDNEPKSKHPRGAQGQQQQQRGEQLPARGNKKLVDKIQNPHVQAIIRDQIDRGENFTFLI